MNIFVTNPCPVISAYEHCQRHATKMVLEMCQMLSTAHRLCDPEDDHSNLYKLTHANHPCSVWVRQSTANYKWAYRHLEALSEVYTLGSGKVHASWEKLSERLSQPPEGIPEGDMTEHPTVVVGIDKTGDVYRDYQTYMKCKFREWAGRDRPLKVVWSVDVPNWVEE